MIKKLFFNIADRYKQLNIQTLLVFSFTFIAVLTIVLMGFALFWRFAVDRTQQQEENSEDLLNQMSINVENYLQSMINISDSVADEIVSKNDILGGDFLTGMDLIYKANIENLASIAIFDKNGVLVEGVPYSHTKNTVDTKNALWFTSAINGENEPHFFTPYVQNIWQAGSDNYNWVVSLSTSIELNRVGQTEKGVLLVDMNFRGIENIFPQTTDINDGYIYLMSGTGELIYHPKQQLIYTNIFEENNLRAAEYEDGNYNEVYNGDTRQISIKTVDITGWKLVSVSPSYSVFDNFPSLFYFAFLLMALFVVMVIYFNLRISHYIADPIKKLDDSVRQLEAGDDNVEFPDDGCLEIKRLSSSVKSMVKNMRSLFSVILQQESDKNRTELEVLNSQINPHFLYNSLDSVVWMNESGRYEEAKQMVLSLARLFRIALSKGSNIISIDNELEHATNYMIIQKIRYKDKFEFNVNLQESAKNTYILKLSLQPLLENAIYHGMAAALDDGLISVNVYLQDNFLIADVVDNGIGIAPQKAEKLLDEKHAGKGFTHGSGIGLYNVDKRIRLTFGKQYGLQIISKPDEGTTIRTKMPIIYKETLQEWSKDSNEKS